MGKRKYDWQDIDLKYITGDMSLHELADLTGIPYHTIVAHARKVRYFDQRAEYKKTVLRKAARELSKRDANYLNSIITVTEKAIAILDEHMTDDATLHNYVIGGEEKRLNKMDTKAFRNMCGSLRDVAYAMKALYPDNEGGDENQQSVIIMPDKEETE